MPYARSKSLILSLALASLTIQACDDSKAGKNGTADGVNQKVTDVKVLNVTPTTFVDLIEVTGTVQADIETELSTEEPGVIEEVYLDKGEAVKKGEPILKLKDDVLQASQAEAEAVFKLSEATFQRQANLYKDNVISEQKYLEYKYALDRDRAQLENLQARLERTVIRSPLTGIIDDRPVEIGQFVAPGTPVARLVKTDTVRVAADVPEQYIVDVRLGATATITFDIMPGQEFEGAISFVGPSIKRTTRTFPIEIALRNKEQKLKPAMFANIKIKRNTMENAVVIPRDAVIETETGKYVFVASGEISVRRDVQLGGSFENRIQITSGLEPGDQLIVVGHRDLVDGDRIAVHQ